MNLALIGVDHLELEIAHRGGFVARRHMAEGLDDQAADGVEFLVAEVGLEIPVELLDETVDALASELGEISDASGGITELRHVRSVAEKKAAEEIANRDKCADFDKFEGMFKQVQFELSNELI